VALFDEQGGWELIEAENWTAATRGAVRHTLAVLARQEGAEK